MTRNLPWLAELVPHMFVEISEELAKEKGIKNKDKIFVSTHVVKLKHTPWLRNALSLSN